MIPSLRTQGKYGALSINEPVDTEPVRQRRRPVCVCRARARARARPLGRVTRAPRADASLLRCDRLGGRGGGVRDGLQHRRAQRVARRAPPPREAAVYATSARLFETRLEPWAGVGLKEVTKKRLVFAPAGSGPVSAEPGPAGGPISVEGRGVVQLNASARHQHIVGFGGAFTDASARVWARLPPAARQRVIDLYFGPDGIGYTLGACTSTRATSRPRASRRTPSTTSRATTRSSTST